MTDKEEVLGMSRRKYVQLLGGSAATVGIAGCSGNGDGGDGGGGGGGDGGDGGDGGSTPTQTSGTQYETLSMQHWWTSGAGGRAMDLLQEEFMNRHSEIEIQDNPVAGGAGQNLQSVIRNRVLQGNPPSTWQDWPGRNLADYVAADALKDISALFEEGGMFENYREGPLLAARAGDPDNPPVAVPLNIHRVNNLFYDIASMEEAGVDPTSLSDPHEYNEMLEQIDSALDKAALSVSLSAPWTALQLWVANFLGLHGAEAYNKFRAGEGDVGMIAEALEVTKTQFDYVTDDAGSISNDTAHAKLPQGEAATGMEGDWMAGNLIAAEGYNYDEQWQHIAWPGSGDIYNINTDGFPYPKPNPSPNSTDEWMLWVGSAEAQRMFNPIKGAIPPRSDVDISEFNPFLQDQFEDYTNTTGVLTVTHGDGATPQQGTTLKNAMSRFISRENVDATAPALRDAMTL